MRLAPHRRPCCCVRRYSLPRYRLCRLRLERNPHPVIARLMSFDVNADHRISREELPERLQGLIARGDGNADAALDSNETRDLVNAASSERTRVPFRAQPSEGLPGVIKDLKLAPARHAKALAIVSANRRSRNVNDPTGLYAELRTVLEDEEYENFVAAAARLSGGRIIK